VTRRFQRRLVVRVGTRFLEAFDVSFSITRTLDYSQNTAQIAIYNLSADTRRDLQSRTGAGVNCEVLAGYSEDKEPARMFLGDLRVISSKRQGPDWVTTLESGDGDTVKQTEVVGSWGEGTSVKRVITELGGQLTVAGGNLVAALTGVSDKPLDGPLSVSGRGDDALANQLDKLDLEHSWQDQELQVVKKNVQAGGTAVLLSAETGMLDSPEVQGIRGFIRVPIVGVRSLLNPYIRPGGLIRIDSPNWSGLCTARRVVHTGNSFGGDWFTEVEAMVHGS
jgi:hypothetical protein